jgi:hypothetical protein
MWVRVFFSSIYFSLDDEINYTVFCFSFCFLKQSSTTKVDASVETVSIGLATEPDQLGPCEPVCLFSFNLISFV